MTGKHNRNAYMRKYMKRMRSQRRKVIEKEWGEVFWVCEECGLELPPEKFPRKGKGRMYRCEACCGEKPERLNLAERLEIEAFLKKG